MTCKCLMDTCEFWFWFNHAMRYKNFSWIVSRFEEKYEKNLWKYSFIYRHQRSGFASAES